MLDKGLAATAVLLTLSATPVAASNVLFILDASGSMWGKVEDRLKIATAKTALSELVSKLPTDTKTGLVVYGHRDKSSCTDVETLIPVGRAGLQDMVGAIAEIKPLGKTPIAYALQQTPDAFIGLEQGDNGVVLISDGKETCGGDPCAVAGQLARSNINVKVHVVGFDIAAKDREQLKCIADKGGGQYFSVDSTEGLVNALEQAVRMVEATAPTAPPEPQRERVFFDDFDGDGLAEHWTVNNPNIDAYLVEDGKLLAFSGQTTGFHDPQMTNLFTLNTQMPDGDWDAIITLTGEFRTGRDQFWFGLRKDHENFLTADLSWYLRPGSTYDYITLRLLKHSKGAPTETINRVYESNAGDQAWADFLANQEANPSTITLSKRGRNYSASYTNGGLKDENSASLKVFETDTLTSLRLPGQLTFGVSKWQDAKGEVLSYIDSVEIISVKE